MGNGKLELGWARSSRSLVVTLLASRTEIRRLSNLSSDRRQSLNLCNPDRRQCFKNG